MIEISLTSRSNVPFWSNVNKFCSSKASPAAYKETSSNCRIPNAIQNNGWCVSESDGSSGNSLVKQIIIASMR